MSPRSPGGRKGSSCRDEGPQCECHLSLCEAGAALPRWSCPDLTFGVLSLGAAGHACPITGHVDLPPPAGSHEATGHLSCARRGSLVSGVTRLPSSGAPSPPCWASQEGRGPAHSRATAFGVAGQRCWSAGTSPLFQQRGRGRASPGKIADPDLQTQAPAPCVPPSLTELVPSPAQVAPKQ